MKIVLTGTHFTPAQAVIEELQKQPGVEIVYIGRKYTREGDETPSVESQVLPQLGVRFIPIISGRLQRSFTRYTIPSLLKIPLGLAQAFYYLAKEGPDVVVAFGGYLSVPVVISAWLLSIPVIIHEQTLVGGLAHQINSWFASKIAVSFESRKTKEKKVVVTGNPIRKEVLQNPKLKSTDPVAQFIEKAKKSSRPIVVVTGGNQGSHIINQAVSQILPDLLAKVALIHQTGDSKFQDFEQLMNLKNSLKNSQNYLVCKWLQADQMGAVLRNCDLVIARGGINTLQELAYFQLPTLVIPIPYVANDEQTKNAHFFEKAGLAQVLLQSNLTAHNLLVKIWQMLDQIDNLKSQAQNARHLIITDAAQKLALETMLLAQRNR